MNGNTKTIFLHWEKFRIGYNLILFGEALWGLREHLVSAFTQLWNLMILFAIGANICFFIGPLGEICVRTVYGFRADRNFDHPFWVRVRYFLFSVGLGFSIWLVWDVAHIVAVECSVIYNYEP